MKLSKGIYYKSTGVPASGRCQARLNIDAHQIIGCVITTEGPTGWVLILSPCRGCSTSFNFQVLLRLLCVCKHCRPVLLVNQFGAEFPPRPPPARGMRFQRCSREGSLAPGARLHASCLGRTPRPGSVPCGRVGPERVCSLQVPWETPRHVQLRVTRSIQKSRRKMCKNLIHRVPVRPGREREAPLRTEEM